MRYIWNQRKAAQNKRDHGVNFAEAREAFEDFNALIEPDEAHSWDERRYRMIAASSRRLLFIIYTAPDEETIRLISAREVEPYERSRYYEES